MTNWPASNPPAMLAGSFLESMKHNKPNLKVLSHLLNLMCKLSLVPPGSLYSDYAGNVLVVYHARF
jgi:hypothetical protein